MKSLLAAAAAIAVLAPVTARAGTYVGAGVGTAASTGGYLSDYGSEGRHSGRLFIGQSFGIISIEGGINDYGLTTSRGTVDWNAMGLVGAVKLQVPIIPMLDGYVRVGLEHTWISTDAAGANGLDGDGWTGALGAQYKLDAVLANASVWADVSRDTITLKRGNVTDDASAKMFTIGLSLGI